MLVEPPEHDSKGGLEEKRTEPDIARELAEALAMLSQTSHPVMSNRDMPQKGHTGII